MPLGYYTEPNEWPERSGQHIIIAQRFSTVYRIKLIRYGDKTTRVRVYPITKAQYRRLVTRFGRIITHTRRESEYLIVPDRTIKVFCAKHKGVKRVAVAFPNNTSHLYNVSAQRLNSFTPKWHVVFDHNHRWLVSEKELT